MVTHVGLRLDVILAASKNSSEIKDCGIEASAAAALSSTEQRIRLLKDAFPVLENVPKID